MIKGRLGTSSLHGVHLEIYPHGPPQKFSALKIDFDPDKGNILRDDS